jgi:hypothetical protein
LLCLRCPAGRTSPCSSLTRNDSWKLTSAPGDAGWSVGDRVLDHGTVLEPERGDVPLRDPQGLPDLAPMYKLGVVEPIAMVCHRSV